MLVLWEDDGLPKEEPRHGIHRLNTRVVPVPKKRKRKSKVDPELLEDGAPCPSCGSLEAGVRGFENLPWCYRLNWKCQGCGYAWTEEKYETPGLPAPGSDLAAGGEAAG